MPWLSINADDLGMTPGVTEGILRAMREGVVTSASAMTCVPMAESLLRPLAPLKELCIGVHLQMTEGTPVLSPEEVPSLVAANGKFHARREHVPQTVKPDELYAEWKAQIARLRWWGIEPAYMDSHHHVHQQPWAVSVFAQIATEEGLPCRGGRLHQAAYLRQLGTSCADQSIQAYYNGDLSADHIRRLLKIALAESGPDAVLELVCHPGIADEALIAMSTYSQPRETELEVLTSAYCRKQIEKLGFELVPMTAVRHLRPARVLHPNFDSTL